MLGVSNEVGIFLNEKLQAEETNQSYFVVAKNEFCYNPYRINVGSIGLNTNDYDNQIISGAYIVFACKEDELNPKYLDTLFKSKGFLNYVNDKANGGVRMNFKFEDMEAWEIPLPYLDEQNAIVAQIEKQKAIIEGADLVLKNWELQEVKIEGNEKQVSDLISEKIVSLSSGEFLPANSFIEGTYPVYGGNGITGYHNTFNFNEKTISIGRVGALCGNPHISKTECWITDNSFALVVKDESILIPEYLYLILKTKNLNQFKKQSAQPVINQDVVKSQRIPLPKIELQQKLVDELFEQYKILDGLRTIKTEAQKIVNQILSDVWGVEYVEPENELVEDEQEN